MSGGVELDSGGFPLGTGPGMGQGWLDLTG